MIILCPKCSTNGCHPLPFWPRTDAYSCRGDDDDHPINELESELKAIELLKDKIETGNDISFFTFYTHHIDGTGHQYGHDSIVPEYKQASITTSNNVIELIKNKGLKYIATELNISNGTVQRWVDNKKVPKSYQFEIKKLCNGPYLIS